MHIAVDRAPVIRATLYVDFPIILTLGGPKMKCKRYTEEKIISILNEHEEVDPKNWTASTIKLLQGERFNG